MKFFQRAIDGSNSYCECAREQATYFQNADKDMKPIGELLTDNGSFVANVPPSDGELPAPLPMPVMNFGDQEQVQNESDHLPLPCMNFEPKKDKDKKVNSDDLLPLPSMQF